MKRVLITDDCHPLLREGLEKTGYTCDFLPDITPEETLRVIPYYEGLIINSKIWVNRAFLDAAVKLRFVGRLGSGMEIVDRAYAAERGVAVLGSPEGNRNAVAEQALGDPVERMAGRAHLDKAPTAVEQLHRELLFQAVDLFADSRLADAQVLGGEGETAGLRHRMKGP